MYKEDFVSKHFLSYEQPAAFCLAAGFCCDNIPLAVQGKRPFCGAETVPPAPSGEKANRFGMGFSNDRVILLHGSTAVLSGAALRFQKLGGAKTAR